MWEATISGKPPVDWWNGNLRIKTLETDKNGGGKSYNIDVDDNDGDNDEFLTSYMVGLQPDVDQRRVLNEMIRVSNHAYNLCIHLVKNKGVKPSQKELQKIVVKTNAKDVDSKYRLDGDDWFFENKMSTIKLTACREYSQNYSIGAKKKKKLGTDKFLPTKEKGETENEITGSIGVQKLYVNKLTEKHKKKFPTHREDKHLMILPVSLIRPMCLTKSVRKLPPFDHDMRIIKRADGYFILCIPCKPEYTRRKFNKEGQNGVCGVDPGGRTMATIYDPVNRHAWQVGTQQDKKYLIKPLQNKIDAVMAQLQLAIGREQKSRIMDKKRELKKLHTKMKRIINNIHCDFSNELVKTNKLVVLGDMKTAKIVNKTKKKGLPKKANRDLIEWRHNEFKKRLIDRAKGSGCKVVIQDEAYTSKTCGRCGRMKDNLGSAETFVCDTCRYETHRDVNGARNILRKYTKHFVTYK